MKKEKKKKLKAEINLKLWRIRRKETKKGVYEGGASEFIEMT